MPLKLPSYILKAFARIGILKLLTVLVVGGFLYSPISAFTSTESTTPSAFVYANEGSVFLSSHLYNQHHVPSGIPSEEESIEELVEDLTESHNDAANQAHFTVALLARSSLSVEENPHPSPNLLDGQTPLYVLFHSWKSFLV